MPSRPIRILVIVNVYRPDLGGGVLFADMCEGLAERGYDVTVRCAYSYYPEWKDKTGQNGFHIQTSTEQGVRIHRHGLYIPSNPNSLFQRLIYEASFFLSLVRRLPDHGDFDVVHVFCPLVGAVGYGILAARHAGAPLWLNVQDLSAQAAAAGGMAGRAGALLAGIQNALFRKAGTWSSISGPMVRALASIEGAPEHVHLLPNWLHKELASEVERHAHVRVTPNSPLRLLYSGNLGSKQDLLRFCQTLQNRPEPFIFRIHADGARAQEMREWIRTTGDDRFIMASLTDEAGLAEWLGWCDYYVVTERAGSGSSFIPSKLIPAMTSGAPILAVCDPDGPLGEEVRQHGTGRYVSWGTLEATDLLTDHSAFEKWSRNARERSAYYERESGIDRYETLLNHLLNPDA